MSESEQQAPEQRASEQRASEQRASEQPSEQQGGIAAVQGRLARRWNAIQAEHGWVRHVAAAWAHLQRNNGSQYAAAITYFSFLALFPLILLAVSVTGFVLHSHPGAEQELFAKIAANVPGSFGTTLKTALKTAIDQRAGVGIVGLAGVLLTGLGWIGNLRAAIDAVWGRTPPPRNFIMARVANLLVLAGLGAGVLASLGLTVVGTSLTDQLLRAIGFDHIPGSTILLKVLGIAVAVLGDMVIFWWLLVKLADAHLERRLAFRGVLLAAVGFEVLKIVGTFTIAHTANSPTAGPFAGIIAVLVWIQLVSRWMLFSCAWLATASAAGIDANRVPVMPSAVGAAAGAPAASDASGVSPGAVAGVLVGVGAAVGSVATWAATREPSASGRRRRKSADEG